MLCALLRLVCRRLVSALPFAIVRVGVRSSVKVFSRDTAGQVCSKRPDVASDAIRVST